MSGLFDLMIDHGFLGVETPVGEGDIGDHSAYESQPVEWQLGQWCHGYTCIIIVLEELIKMKSTKKKATHSFVNK